MLWETVYPPLVISLQCVHFFIAFHLRIVREWQFRQWVMVS